MNPYESPNTDPVTASHPKKRKLNKAIKEYFSLSGSFSRTELLIATIAVIGLYSILSISYGVLSGFISPLVYLIAIYSLYPIWGIALGKRSRDLGTTFTYGMIVGMVFPIIGVVFLFQGGAKSKLSKKVAEQVAASDS